MSSHLLKQIINSKKALKDIPVIAQVDFGHTDPKLTLPIGGEVQIEAVGDHASIVFVKH